MMDRIRNYLLENGLIELYSLFLTFMRTPSNDSEAAVLATFPEQLYEIAAQEMASIKQLFRTDKKGYEKTYTYGQVIIWELILKAYLDLSAQKKIIESLSVPTKKQSYVLSEKDVKAILIPYAKMQVVFSELEEALGVDRFLDRICEDTFSVLNSIMVSAKNIVEENAESLKRSFQEKWGNNNVYHVLSSSLISRNNDNQICDQFSSDNEQVIFFLIDGFGYCQYLWNSAIDTKNEHFTYKENVFQWLRENQLIREHILGSAFISDTGAGLAQIFLGQGSNETGIFASKIKKKGAAQPFIETKRIASNQFQTLFDYHNSITDIAAVLKGGSEVYYCSRYSTPPSGFSAAIFKSADVEQVLPPERVFSLLLEKMANGTKKGLQVVYLTGIDNSGHTMGAYSKFERMEHLKIDTLLRNYLVELAISTPELFDGKRSIFLSADHGMFESSKIMVDRNELLRFLNRRGVFDIKLVENNRALLVYNEGPSSLEKVKTVLADYFNNKKLFVDIKCEQDDDFNYHLPKTKYLDIRPDFVVRYIGQGLFYSNPNTNKHLFHFGGHGGCSVDEVFVPLLEIPLNQGLLGKISERFIRE